MKLFIDDKDIVIAIHDEEQNIPDNAYDGVGYGAITVIHLAPENLPQRQYAADGVTPLQLKMPPLWRDGFLDDVPEKVTSTQGKLALLGAGKLSDAQAAIDALEGDAKLAAEIKWAAANWFRSDPLFNELGTGIGLTVNDIDNLFRQARNI